VDGYEGEADFADKIANAAICSGPMEKLTQERHQMLTNRAVAAFRAVAVLAVLLVIPGYMAVKSRPQFGKAKVNQAAVSANPAAKTANAERLAENFGKLPLNFEPNVGQTDSRVKYLARANGYMVFLTPDEAVLEIHSEMKKGKTAPPEVKTAALAMKFAGARTAQVEGSGQLPGRVNYILGNDPSKWHTNVTTYSEVKYSNIYPGVDLLFHGNGRQLEYDFVVSPGADASRIDLQIDGAQSIQVEKSGDALLETKLGGLELKRPLIYQEVNGQKKEVAGGYVLKNSHELLFKVGPYNRDQALVIDPLLQYSTYLGGSLSDYATGLAADSTGATYITGSTVSTDFPIANGYISTNPNGGGAANMNYTGFVTKINPGGTALVYSTYLGGTTPISTVLGAQAQDYPNAIAVDTSFQAYVVGQTFDTDFPVTPNTAFEATQQAKANSAFLFVFNAAGSGPVYSTYMGAEMGALSSTAAGVAVDNLGGAYVTGNTNSFNFPVTPGAFETTFPSNNEFSPWVTKFNTLMAMNLSVAYSSFLGGSGSSAGLSDTAFGIAVDASGDAYATGDTVSTDFPTMAPFQGTLNGPENAYVTEFNPAGTGVLSSTYLGGSDMDGGTAITVDGSGSAYVTGSTSSTDFPTTTGVFQTVLAGESNAFVTKFAVGGGVSTLSYSTYLGGSIADTPNAIAVDSLGQAYVGGKTFSTNFPTVSPFQATNQAAPGSNGFISQLNPTGTGLIFSSYIGGSGNSAVGSGDEVNGVGLDALDNIYLGGTTISTNFPVVSPLQCCTTLGGPEDAFVAEVNTSPVTVMPTALAFGNVVEGVTSPAMNLTVTNGSSSTISVTNVSITGTNAGDFAATISSGCASILAGGTCTVPVTFKPSTVGPESASLQLITTAPENPGPVALTGTGVTSTPTVTLSPTSLTFPAQTVGTTSSAMSVTLTNTGGSNLTITSITVTGTNAPDFAQINTCGIVDPGGSCTITVTFTPSIVGAESADISIADNAPNSPQTVPLSGTGAAGPAAVLTPASLIFPSQIVNTSSAAMTVTLSNPGTVALAITSITVTGANASSFSQTNTCGSTLAAGANCPIMVVFKPTATGTLTAAISVADNAPGTPQMAALTGTGTPSASPSVSFSPVSLTFPGTAVGASAPAMNVVLTNSGGGALTITGITVTGTNSSSFTQTNTCGSTVNAGANCSIIVTFTPTTTGALTAAISVADNAAGSPQMVQLQGTGATFLAPAVSPTSLTLTAGQTGMIAATVTSVAPFAGTVTVSCTGAPAAATCIPSPMMLTLTPGSSATSMVAVTTTARGLLPPAGSPQAPVGPLTAVPVLAMAVLAGMFIAMRRTGRMDATMGRCLAGIGLASVLLWVGLLAACGGSSGSSTTGTPAGNYTLTITAASGSTTMSTTVPLTVQ
jgi:hypothetical protein